MSQPQIFLCPSDRFPDAAGLLVGAGPSAGERFLAHARQTGLSIERLLCMGEPTGKLLCAVLPIVAPGRTAMIATSEPTSLEKAELLGALIAHAAQLVSSEVDLSQALVPPERILESHAFECAGFSKLATLAYLERPMPRLFAPTLPPLAEGWSIESVDLSREGVREALCTLLNRTYEQTLDCPELAGIRKTADVLEGHARAGTGVRWWVTLRDHAGKAQGLALLNAAVADGTSELVYFGLAPEARGKGLGIALLTRAIGAVTRERRGTVVLAMDTRNAPARKLYAQLGFREVAQRVALIKRS